MISIKKISVPQTKELIRTAYEGDKDILATQHIMPLDDIDTAVELTYGMIKKMAAEKKLYCYKVVFCKKSIGYFANFDNYLFSFGINKAFRKKDLLIGWWNLVQKSLKKNFMCILYPHQVSAIEFLKKNGMVVLEVDTENNAIILMQK